MASPVLFFDCFSGISGDMTVAALCDLGVAPARFEAALARVALSGYHLHFARDQRQHVAGVRFTVHDETAPATPAPHHAAASAATSVAVAAGSPDGSPPGHFSTHASHHAHTHTHTHASHHTHTHAHSHHASTHDHDHDHGHAPGRTYRDIRRLLETSGLSDFVRERSLSVFRRLAVAEAKVHGVPLETVGFHEVGAVDSIVDVVAACAGLEELGVTEIVFGPLVDGQGWVQTAHGRFPVPVPATLEILAGAGIPLATTDAVARELITPTGAALAAEFGRGFGPLPPLRLRRVGYGLGSRHLPDRPNALRAILGERPAAPPAAGGPGPAGTTAAAAAPDPLVVPGYLTDTILQLETNLDDLSPELTAAAAETLRAAGALDVFLTPVQMKKHRPGVLLTVLCEEDQATVERLTHLVFRHTSAFGLRWHRRARWKLAREVVVVSTPHGPVEVKRGRLAGDGSGEADPGAGWVQAVPEFESCRRLSVQTGVPVGTIYRAAQRAADLAGDPGAEAGTGPGAGAVPGAGDAAGTAPAPDSAV